MGDVCDSDDDNDGVADDVDCNAFDAAVNFSPGATCDDADANTMNDVITADCMCIGEMAMDTMTMGMDTMTMDMDTMTMGMDTMTMGMDTMTMDMDTMTMGMDTMTMGMDTMTMGMDTMTMDMDTMTMGMDTMTMGMDTMTMDMDTMTMGMDTMTMGMDTMTMAGDCDGNKAAFITDLVTDDTGELRLRLGDIGIDSLPVGRMTVSLIKGRSSNDAFVNLSGLETRRADAIIDIRLDDGNGYEFTESGDSQNDGANFPAFSPDQLVNFDISWDASSDTATWITVMIDGQQVAATFQSEAENFEAIADGVRTVQFRFAGNSATESGGAGVIIDDLMVFDGDGNVVFSDDFEGFDTAVSLDPDLNPDVPYAGNTSDASVICISDADADAGDGEEECDGNQFAFVTDLVSDDTGELRLSLNSLGIDSLPSGRMTVSVIKDASSNDAFVNLSGSETRRADAIIDIRLDDNNGYEFTESGDSQNDDANFPGFTPGELVDIDISWEATGGGAPLVSVMIDGQEVADPFPSEAENVDVVADGVRTVQFRFAGNSATEAGGAGLTIDDLTVFDGDGNVVFSDDFESYELGTSLDLDDNDESPYASNTSDATVGGCDDGSTDPRPDDIQDVNNTQPTLNFALAPSVTDGLIRVFSEDLNADAASIFIFNQNGIMMKQIRDVNTFGGIMNTNVDVGDIEQGMYFIRVIGDNGLSSVKRFIKVN